MSYHLGERTLQRGFELGSSRPEDCTTSLSLSTRLNHCARRTAFVKVAGSVGVYVGDVQGVKLGLGLGCEVEDDISSFCLLSCCRWQIYLCLIYRLLVVYKCYTVFSKCAHVGGSISLTTSNISIALHYIGC
jgi:hypothetical protein